MKQKALIVESTRFFQNILEQIFTSAGVESHIYTTGKEALEASHGEYAFILASRTLEDITGEIFLQHYAVQHGLANALTILLTSSEISSVMLNANKAGYKLVFHKKNLESLQDIIISILNSHTLELEANILFIEDTHSIANMIVKLFTNNKATIQHVDRIEKMKAAFHDQAFDLVITDYYLKDKETGDDVISYIRNYDDSNKSSTPILVVSGEIDQKKRTSFLRNGANDFILKPYDNDELLVRSSNLIANNRLLKQSKQQQQELTKLALTDHLTSLYNRHSLYDIGPKYISNAHRHKAALSLLVIDLDHFKKINDTRGHSVGDIVLQSVAAVMQEACRTEDIVARFGGEEFIMLLSNCNLDNAVHKAESIRKAIENCKPEGLTVTSSIGVAELAPGDNFDRLFDRADQAVYKAKETGRNRVVTINSSG